jgi:hypothetical protein
LLDRLSADARPMHETLAKVDRVLAAFRSLGIVTKEMTIHDLFGETICLPHGMRRLGAFKGAGSEI